jgi:hypothetical protein
MIANPNTVLKLKTNEPQSQTHYFFITNEPDMYRLPIDLFNQTNIHEIFFWSTDVHKNEERKQQLPIMFGRTTPTLQNLQATREPHRQAVLTFETYGEIQSYDVRLLRTENTSIQPSLAPESLHVPTIGRDQIFLDSLDDLQTYTIEIRAIDRYGNISEPLTGTL